MAARKVEAERLQAEIAAAQKAALALRHASDLVDIAEGSNNEDLQALRDELRDLLPGAGL